MIIIMLKIMNQDPFVGGKNNRSMLSTRDNYDQQKPNGEFPNKFQNFQLI